MPLNPEARKIVIIYLKSGTAISFIGDIALTFADDGDLQRLDWAVLEGKEPQWILADQLEAIVTFQPE